MRAPPRPVVAPGPVSHPNAETLDQFYRAFQAKDGDAMAAVYADDATFSDPSSAD